MDLFMIMNSFSWGHGFVDKGIHEIIEKLPPMKYNDFTVTAFEELSIVRCKRHKMDISYNPVYKPPSNNSPLPLFV